jgi:hypothetical protein
MPGVALIAHFDGDPPQPTTALLLRNKTGITAVLVWSEGASLAPFVPSSPPPCRHPWLGRGGTDVRQPEPSDWRRGEFGGFAGEHHFSSAKNVERVGEAKGVVEILLDDDDHTIGSG